MHNRPIFDTERFLHAEGYHLIAGIDEAGRGAWAGPVVASAVILPPDIDTKLLKEVNDSKKMSPAKREYCYGLIFDHALAVSSCWESHKTIDKSGILPATKLAMKKAVAGLASKPNYLLIDYLSLPDINISQRGIKFGDALCLSIACASIIAKVTRDRMMVELENEYTGYNLHRNKGYGTREHALGLKKKGPCNIHRKSFRPVREVTAKTMLAKGYEVLALFLCSAI
ncbi:ribonuclease HII [Chloroflexota bacterium]